MAHEMHVHPQRLVSLLGTLLILGTLELPAAHSGAPGARLEPERPPGARGPRAGERPGPHTCRVCRLAGRLDLRMTPLVRPILHRCGGDDRPLRATLPRGRVRAEDLDRLRLDFTEEVFDAYPQLGDELVIELRMGASRITRLGAPLLRVTEYVPVPASLRARLHGLRGCIRWGVFGTRDAQTRGAFWLDPPSRREDLRLQRIEQRTATAPGWMRRVIRAQALLDATFDLAALREAQAVLRERPGEPHATAIVHLAWRLLGLGDFHEALDHKQHVLRALAAQPARPPADCRLAEPLPAALRARAQRPGGCGRAVEDEHE